MGIEVYIEQSLYRHGVEIFIVNRNPMTDEVDAVAKHVELEFDKYEPGQKTERATLEIYGRQAKGLLEALSKELNRKGIKPESDSKLEGKLEATKYHLEDMRKLIFKKDRG